MQKNIIFVSGDANSGKSTTLGRVYERLFQRNHNHFFCGRAESSLSWRIGDGDFFAVFKIGKRTIGIISAGDQLAAFRNCFEKLDQEHHLDVLICATHLQYKGGSVLEFVMEKLPKQNFMPFLRFCTFPAGSVAETDWDTMENEIADAIMLTLEHRLL